jgi:hypothetical protein
VIRVTHTESQLLQLTSLPKDLEENGHTKLEFAVDLPTHVIQIALIACVLEAIILQETILQAQLPLRPPTSIGMKLTQFK